MNRRAFFASVALTAATLLHAKLEKWLPPEEPDTILLADWYAALWLPDLQWQAMEARFQKDRGIPAVPSRDPS